ncbi:GNAT family N-acetyltransferase [Longirhabdus pacifica]|uniref:GNAT family N-acetyltransferase n=1 Tax=Longirhabdus pacifica TaxID=2305227 RepID=UPI0010089F57|nr:GNAT family N-acetyltransferase [Longirhabdus pacifica]
MYIRTFQLSDYVAISQLLQTELSERCYDETRRAFAHQLNWDSELVLVAVLDDEIVGTIIGTIDHEEGYFYRVIVQSNCLHKNCEVRLIEAMNQCFAQHQVKRVLVTVDEYNHQLQFLCKSLGFVTTNTPCSEKKLSILTG